MPYRRKTPVHIVLRPYGKHLHGKFLALDILSDHKIDEHTSHVVLDFREITGAAQSFIADLFCHLALLKIPASEICTANVHFEDLRLKLDAVRFRLAKSRRYPTHKAH